MKQKGHGSKLSTQRTRKQMLLDANGEGVPRGELLARTTPHAPMAKTGRFLFDLAMMLRIDCLQRWFGMSALGANEALFETGFCRDFAGISGTSEFLTGVASNSKSSVAAFDRGH